MIAAAVALALAAAPVHRYALVIGSNTGEGVRVAPLRFADDDAVSMHELLLEAGVESVLLTSLDADTQRLHPRTQPIAPPTLDAIRGAFAAQRASMERAKRAGEPVEWLFFFSGHGDVDRGEGFLGLERGRLTRAVLHDELLFRVPADRSHVILDACRSGALIASKGPGGLRLPMPTAFAADPQWPASAGFVLSASSSKESHEYERYQSGVFSYEVRSALRGAADLDADGTVTYAELGAFLEIANRGIENPRFRPEFLTLPPKVGLSAAVLTWPESSAVTELKVDTHAYVERPNGERLVDVHTLTQSARLHLPGERPLFVRSDDERREFALESQTTISVLNPVTNATARKGALDRALTQLFSSAFEPPHVEAFTTSWKPVELSVLELPEPPVSAVVSRHVAGWRTVGAVVASGIGFSVAWTQQSNLGALDQRERVMRNEAITAGNVTGIVGLSVAVLAGITWGVLTWKFDLPLLFRSEK